MNIHQPISNLHKRIVDTVREPLVVLDLDLRVVSANPSFCDTFAMHAVEAEGHLIYELGNGQWDIPRLRMLLEEILPVNNVFSGFEIEHTFEHIGRRTLLLNARRIDGHRLIVLAIEDVTRHRKEAETVIEQEKDLAQLYMEVASVMMVALDRAGRVTMINQAGCETLEYPEEDIRGKDWFAHFLPERARAQVREVFHVLLAGDVEAIEYIEHPVLTKSGHERLILWHNALLRNEHGEVSGTLGSGTDITERKQAEQTLRESERRFRSLFEASPDAIFVEDLEGNVLDVNPAACRLHNASFDALINMNVRDLVPPAQREAASRDFEKLVRGEVEYVHSYSWTVNKHAIPVEIRANRFIYDGKEAVLLIVRDISERTEVMDALEESQARAEAILATTMDAVITIDEQGLIESVNPAAEGLLGYTAREMMGRNVKMLMPTPYHEVHDDYIQHYLDTGEKRVIGKGHEVVARHKEGTVFPIELNVGEVRFDGQRRFTGFIRDIRKRRALEREVLRISEEERQRIGQDIHDGLASHFSGIALLSRGLVNQLKQGQPGNTEVLEEIARLAQRGAEHARALARGLNPVKLDGEGLRSALEELVHSAEILSGITCSLDISQALPLLKRDTSTQLYRIIQEAINNVLKHAGATHLLLRVYQTESHLLLTVKDNGQGLPNNLHEADGMGMHIMPYRARVIGATLSIESVPNEGTTITCSVPLVSSSESHQTSKRTDEV